MSCLKGRCDFVLIRSFIRRLVKIEQKSLDPRWFAVLKESDGRYSGICGSGLSQEQFDAWVKAQDGDTQIIVVEVCENKPLTPCDAGESVTFKVDNFVDKNGADLLKAFEKEVKQASEYFLFNVDTSGYSDAEKSVLDKSCRIVRIHQRPVV
jgi:hypothetical protein